MKKIKIQNIIGKCLVDYLTPLALMYGVYIIAHGHVSPGGGFQGGVLIASCILFVYLGYGRKGMIRFFSEARLSKVQESFEILYSLLALAGVFAGLRFGFNFVISDSVETTMFMNAFVGFIVSSRLITLLLRVFSIPPVLAEEEAEEEEEEI